MAYGTFVRESGAVPGEALRAVNGRSPWQAQQRGQGLHQAAHMRTIRHQRLLKF